MSSPASVFASHARQAKNFVFKCSMDCTVGAYSLNEGEPLKAVRQPNGLYAVHVEWSEGHIASLRASDVNKLAGCELIESEPMCTGTDPVHCDDPKCKVHWVR